MKSDGVGIVRCHIPPLLPEINWSFNIKSNNDRRNRHRAETGGQACDFAILRRPWKPRAIGHLNLPEEICSG
jgi:hypothetical protein